ncbi:Sterile alpha motif domain containing protein 3 [Dissostichus eleginoides]|uniref:Sterile alpha motif domain containing protein 3 n=1 Tax=Dissostichus eleginoides TaxID=100907 RepID=A0AAD9BVV7_DISEL|nr:Sterile alpha motif domain containing protein 3 [Dissostichus eleginoides]
MEGNGYNTWHMSLKRRFKAERTPLVHHVRNMKQKFGHHRSPQAPENNQGSIKTSVRRSSDIISVSGEDESSIDAHTQVLKRQYLKAQPDSCIVTNAMTKTFQWRRKEVAEGVRADTIANNFHPHLPTWGTISSSDLQTLVTTSNTTNYATEMLVFDAMDFKAGLVLLPIILKEKVEHHVTLEEPGTPYPTTQLTHTDWKSAFTRRGPSVVKTDGFELCRASDLEEGVIAAFCAYFVFNMAYPPNRKNTLTFVQRCILKISVEGDKPLSTTVIRILNQLY